MKVIGLTGGIASGKSTVSQMLEEKGFVVVDADIAAREAVQKGSKGLEMVRAAFGEEAILDGEMNRPYIGAIVFNDPSQRTILNNIIHPIVREIMDAKKQKALSENKNVVMDIPLLFENQLDQTVDEVWVVYVPEHIQLERLKKRNNLTITEAKARINSQLSIEEKRRRADVVIDNSGNLEALQHNVDEVVTQFFNRN